MQSFNGLRASIFEKRGPAAKVSGDFNDCFDDDQEIKLVEMDDNEENFPD